jgi:hypothetical protein
MDDVKMKATIKYQLSGKAINKANFYFVVLSAFLL